MSERDSTFFKQLARSLQKMMQGTPDALIGSLNNNQDVQNSNQVLVQAGSKISTYMPVFVTSSSGSGNEYGTAYDWNGSLEIEFDRGFLGVALSSGLSGDLLMVQVDGVCPVLKKDSIILNAGDIVFCNDNPYVELPPTANAKTQSTNSSGITHFQVVQDASANEDVVMVKFITDIFSRAVPVKIVAPFDDEEATTSKVCSVYPFGPNQFVLFERIPISRLDNTSAEFTVGQWYLGTIIGKEVYVAPSSGGSVRARVEITGSTSPSAYTGNLLTSYFDDTPLNVDPINIIADKVTANVIDNGEKFWADEAVDSNGDTYYIIEVPVTL